ncbi:MAG TPA: TOBE domain-containing protein, partial [Ilumatobacter sp.]|nr:TOBE domain-containing protein [Ilumatobacter sp.]
FVTHDQTEALALADRVVIMKAGRFEQVGSPQDIFESPATEYVADFIGMSNCLPLLRSGDGWTLDGAEVNGTFDVPRELQEIHVRVRPEDLQLRPRGAATDPAVVTGPATVVVSQFGGRQMDVVVQTGEHRMQARVSSRSHDGWGQSLQPDDEVVFAFDSHAALLFTVDGQRIDASGVRP